jgi:hypothetical protein
MSSLDITARNWSQLKQELASKGLLHSVFTTELKVSRDPQSVAQASLKFEPLLLSTHMEKLEDLCEKSLALRREIRELEILSVKSVMDYQLFQKTSVIDEKAEILRLQKPSKLAEKKGQDAAAGAFGTTPELNKGFGLISAGRAEALGDELDGIDQLTQLIKDRWASVRAYQDAYYSRYTEPGNAHNYGERAQNLLAILKKELEEAVDRALALDVGLRTVYRWSPGDVPTEVDLPTLDKFVIWVLEARRGLTWRAERETCFDVVVPVVQPWSDGKTALIPSAQFDAAIRSAANPILLRFKIEPNIFLNQDVRVKGIGLSFGNKFGLVIESGIDRIQTADSFARRAAILTTPEQTDSDGRSYKRPDITLGNIGLHDSSGPAAFVEGNSVTNLNPVGSWEVRIHPWIVWKEAGALSVSEGVSGERIKDLKITFRVYIPAQL